MEEITGEKESEKIIEKRKGKLKNFFFGWVEDNYDKAFIAVFILAILVRIYFFIVTKNQAVWWDAADYLTEAKVLGGIIHFDYSFTSRRTFLMPLLWAGLIKLGFGEFSFRILEFLLSIVAIPAMYFVGKEIFDKKTALLSSFFLSIFWMHLFYSNRLMTEIPTLTFLLLSTLFFWQGYTKKNEKGFILFGIFLGLAFLARAGTLVMFAVFPIFLLMTKNLKFLKNKNLWFGALCTFLLMASFFIFTSYKQKLNAFSYFLAITPETSGGTPRFSNMMGISGIKEYLSAMPHYLGSALLIVSILVGILFLFYFFISLDLILKRRGLEYDKYLYVFLLAFVPFIFQSVFHHSFEDRYIMNAFPAFFIFLSIGIIKITNILKKYNKFLPILIIILILGLGAYQQLTYSNLIISSKTSSYLEVRQSGEWIKENSEKSAIIFSASVPQHTYYAEREVYNYVHPGVNETEFEEKVNKLKPDFLVLSIFEPHAQWVYEYPQNHQDMLIPVKSYMQQNNQPSLIVYKFEYPENNQISNHLNNSLITE